MADSIFGNIAQGAVSSLGILDQQKRFEDLGTHAQEGSQAIADKYSDAVQFKPFTVASGTGNVNVGQDGSIDAQLNDARQGLADSTLAGAQGLFNAAAQDPSSRQNDIFQQIMAGLQPGQERDAMALEGRLFSQGRGGISSNQYGGTPEQLAQAKAVEEARLGAWSNAQTLSMQEQDQQARIGSTLHNASNLDMQTLFNQINPGLNAATLSQNGRNSGASLGSQSEIAGLEGKIQSEKVGADLVAALYGTGANIAGQAGDFLSQNGSDLWDGAKNLYNEFF